MFTETSPNVDKYAEIGAVPLAPTPPTLLNKPPCTNVELFKSVSLDCTIMYPNNIAFNAVFGASTNGSVSIAFLASKRLL